MHSAHLKAFITTLGCCLLLGCTAEAPNAPVCRVNATQLDAAQGDAGCIIRVGQRLLTINHRYSKRLDIPGGSANSDESAQCTAHRETWEETGFNVEVGELLGTSDKGLRFYQCELDDDFGGELNEFPVPKWADSEVQGIQLIEPFSTTHKDWRFPDQLVDIRKMFVTAGQKDFQANNEQ